MTVEMWRFENDMNKKKNIIKLNMNRDNTTVGNKRTEREKKIA
jgi:hypothetical protein